MAYKHLSEPIYLDFSLPDLVGQNIPYTVTYNGNGDPKLIYTGSIYVTGKNQRIYLNDIIATTNDTYSWFRNPKSGQILDAPFKAQFIVSFNDGEIQHTIDDVVYTTKIPYSDATYSVPTEDIIVPMTSFGNSVVPRIPRNLGTVGGDNRIFTMFSLVYNDKVKLYDTFNLILYNGDDTRLSNVTTLYFEQIPNDNVCKFLFGADRLLVIGNKLGWDTPNEEYKKCYLGVVAQTRNNELITPTCKVCEIDDNPADYYVMWINRYGTWQSQPLCSKWEMKEKVTTNSITTVYDEVVPVSKLSEFTWQLNTEWLTYAEHDEFESLLTSKYVYLYNTKTNSGEYVTVSDSNWTFKNSVNTKKPFNLTLNLTKSVKQNIVF